MADDDAELGFVPYTAHPVSTSSARRYTRQHVTLASDGWRVVGTKPGMASRSVLEHELRDRLAMQVRGVTEAVLPYGRADALTSERVFEVESLKRWRDGVRQVLAYSAQLGGTAPCLALFGYAHRDDVTKLYMKLRDGRPRIELWWFVGERPPGFQWLHVSSRAKCYGMSDPLPGLIRAHSEPEPSPANSCSERPTSARPGWHSVVDSLLGDEP